MATSSGSTSLAATRMSKKYRMFLPPGARIQNYAEKASGRPCDICGHVPETRPPKPGYPTVSEEMRVLRVKLKEGTDAAEFKAYGKTDFTVTGGLIEMNVCADSANCRERASQLKNDDGSPKYDPSALALFL